MFKLFADVLPPNGKNKGRPSYSPESDMMDPILIVLIVLGIASIIMIVASVIVVKKASKKNGKKPH